MQTDCILDAEGGVRGAQRLGEALQVTLPNLRNLRVINLSESGSVASAMTNKMEDDTEGSGLFFLQCFSQLNLQSLEVQAMTPYWREGDRYYVEENDPFKQIAEIGVQMEGLRCLTFLHANMFGESDYGPSAESTIQRGSAVLTHTAAGVKDRLARL